MKRRNGFVCFSAVAGNDTDEAAIALRYRGDAPGNEPGTTDPAVCFAAVEETETTLEV
jgi:hypothetical protein